MSKRTGEKNLICYFSIAISVKDEESLLILRLLLCRQLCHSLQWIINTFNINLHSYSHYLHVLSNIHFTQIQHTLPPALHAMDFRLQTHLT